MKCPKCNEEIIINEGKVVVQIIKHCRRYSKTPDCPTDVPLTIVKNATALAKAIVKELGGK